MKRRSFRKKEMHLVKWSIICREKRKGGLEIKTLSLLNRALMGNGIREMLLKEKPFGKGSLKESMERRKEVSVLAK